MRNIAEVLAGGPRYTTTIDPTTGATTRTQVPVSGRNLGLAIAMEAISGGLAGLGQTGPNHAGRAAAAGVTQGVQQVQQQRQLQEQQAQQQFANQSKALAQKAAIFDTNARAILNVSEAEKQGLDTIRDLVNINRQSGILDVDPSLLDNDGRPMTQDELMAGIKSGSISSTDHLGPIAGAIQLTNPDGSTRIEATHLVIKDPNSTMRLTQQMWDRYADAGAPGFPKGVKIGNGVDVPIRIVANANEVTASHYLANQRLSDLKDVLDGTQYADKVPASIDFSQPGVAKAVQRWSTYVSHNSDNLDDPYAALQAMSAAKRDPKTGAMQLNPDAASADIIAGQLGGWTVLRAAHDQMEAQKKTAGEYQVIDTADKANAVLAAPKRFSPDQVTAAKNFITLSNQQGERKAAQDARARAQAEGTDVEAMYRFGKNPVSGAQLTLDNAPDSMLVSASGQVIPQELVSTYKPTAQERQTADTARQVLAISAGLQQAIQQNPNLAGPLSGRSKQAIAKLGYGDAQAQKFLDDISFLQSASTKMHTGRFSNEILKKMDSIIQPGMNPDQFTGALSSINGVASRYASEDQLTTVGDFKRQQQTPQNPAPVAGGRQVQIPAGAQIGRDGQGRIVGYQLGTKWVSLTGGQQ